MKGLRIERSEDNRAEGVSNKGKGEGDGGMGGEGGAHNRRAQK